MKIIENYRCFYSAGKKPAICIKNKNRQLTRNSVNNHVNVVMGLAQTYKHFSICKFKKNTIYKIIAESVG